MNLPNMEPNLSLVSCNNLKHTNTTLREAVRNIFVFYLFVVDAVSKSD